MMRVRVLCLLPNLNGGGAERVMIYLLKGLDHARFDLTLGLLERIGPYLPLVPTDVPTIELGSTRVATTVAPLARIFRRGAYDVCYSMMSMNLAAVAAREIGRSDVRLVLGARTHYSSRFAAEGGAFAWLKRAQVRLLYPRADLVIGISRGVRDDLVEHFGVPPGRAGAIHNPIDLEAVRAQAAEVPDHPWLQAGSRVPVLVAVGRLQEFKGYRELLLAFRTVRREVEARLLILGDGPMQGWIREYARRNGFADDVDLVGFQRNPYAFLARATLFVHAARWEGFGNVIVEAMACGAPVVATDCPSGPREIITSDDEGLLVPVGDSAAFAAAVITLVNDAPRRERIRSAAAGRAAAFSIERIVPLYAAAFEQVTHA